MKETRHTRFIASGSTIPERVFDHPEDAWAYLLDAMDGQALRYHPDGADGLSDEASQIERMIDGPGRVDDTTPDAPAWYEVEQVDARDL